MARGPDRQPENNVDKVIEILLIEDNLPDADYLRELLADEKGPGFPLTQAGRLAEGLSFLGKRRFDIILLDLGLPDSQGIDTLLAVRKRSPDIPLIVLTGLADQEFAVKAIQSGADDYLIKGQITSTLLQRTILYTIERRHITEQLRRSEEQYRLLFETSPFPLWVYCRKALSFLAVNNAALHLYGYTREEFLAMIMQDLHDPGDLPRLVEAEKSLPGPFRRTGIWKQRKKDGSYIDVDISTHDLTFDGKAARLALAQDVTQLRKAEETIKYQAYHDALTGLPNREQLMLKLDLELAQAGRNGNKLAVLHVDIDRFRAINDSLGHATGDKVIKVVTDRLGSLIRKSDTLARLGSDEFVILLADLSRPEDAALFSETVLERMRRPFTIDKHELFTTVSIGISMYPEDGRDPELLIKNADIAVSSAKESGRNNFQFFNAALNRRTVERLLLESSLRQSLERGELSVHYQPQVDIRSGKMTGVEALCRWNHPELGMLEPSRFIPVAEEIGFVTAIDEWVLRTAAAQNRKWLETGLPPLCMSVDISAQRFQDPDLVSTVKTILDEAGLEPRYLDIEITESTAMRDIDRSVPNLRGLHELGIDLSIDDFGTGYSSLHYLKRFPVKKLKIDQSFIRGLVEDKDDQAIVKAVIAMGHHLNLKIIAEGVETQEQLAFLRRNDCDEIQGYVYSEPVPAESLEMLLAA